MHQVTWFAVHADGEDEAYNMVVDAVEGIVEDPRNRFDWWQPLEDSRQYPDRETEVVAVESTEGMAAVDEAWSRTRDFLGAELDEIQEAMSSMSKEELMDDRAVRERMHDVSPFVGGGKRLYRVYDDGSVGCISTEPALDDLFDTKVFNSGSWGPIEAVNWIVNLDLHY